MNILEDKQSYGIDRTHNLIFKSVILQGPQTILQSLISKCFLSGKSVPTIVINVVKHISQRDDQKVNNHQLHVLNSIFKCKHRVLFQIVNNSCNQNYLFNCH